MRKQIYSVRPLDEGKLGLQRKYMRRKVKSAFKGNPKKSRSRIEAKEEELSTMRWELKISLMGINREGGLKFARMERRTPLELS